MSTPTELDRLSHVTQHRRRRGPKPSFPANELEQTVAVLSAPASMAEPISATALAARFRQGRRMLPQVEAVLAALVRVGGMVHSPDGGRTFAPRRAA